MRLVDSVCGPRVLRNRLDLLAREIQHGSELDESERFMPHDEMGKRQIAHRSDDWVRRQAMMIAKWKAEDRRRHQALDIDSAHRKLDAEAPGWRDLEQPATAEAFAACEAMAELEGNDRQCALTRPIDPRLFPSAYWPARVWATRAARVIAKQRSRNKPGSYDHHVVAAACAYADLFVTDDGAVMDQLVPELRKMEPKPRCRFLRFSDWVNRVTA